MFHCLGIPVACPLPEILGIKNVSGFRVFQILEYLYRLNFYIPNPNIWNLKCFQVQNFVRQVLYHLSHASSPFLWLFLRNGLTFCLGWPGPRSFFLCFPQKLGWQVCITRPSFFCWDGGVSWIFVPMLAFNHNLPDLSLLCIWDGMTGMCHCPQLFVEMGSHELFV
jgi:hypothetical protein